MTAPANPSPEPLAIRDKLDAAQAVVIKRPVQLKNAFPHFLEIIDEHYYCSICSIYLGDVDESEASNGV